MGVTQATLIAVPVWRGFFGIAEKDRTESVIKKA